MRSVFLSDKDRLRHALRVLAEDSMERDRQEAMQAKLELRKLKSGKKAKRMSEEEKEEEEAGGEDAEAGGEEGGTDAAAGEEAEPAAGGDAAAGSTPPKEEKKKPKELPGAKKLKQSELPAGAKPTSDDIIARINFIRAGASIRDEKIAKNLKQYFGQFGSSQRNAIFNVLDGIAKITLAKSSAAEAPKPEDIVGKKALGAEPETPETPVARTGEKKVVPKGGQVPITVGESVKRRMKEVDIPLRNGRNVPFGSKAHVAQLEKLIADIDLVRSYQELGSEGRASLGAALRSMRTELNRARRASGFVGNPRVTPTDPLVEDE